MVHCIHERQICHYLKPDSFESGFSVKKIIDELEFYMNYSVPESFKINLEQWFDSYSGAKIYKGYVLKICPENSIVIEKKLSSYIIEILSPGIFLMNFSSDEQAKNCVERLGLDFVGNVKSAKKTAPALGFPEIDFDSKMLACSSEILPIENSMISGSKKEVSKILDGGFFSGPKPIRLMRRLMTLANLEKDSIIVDFFSGSASTAHAVMELNKDDNSNRKFVMVQLPHKCEENSEAAKAGYSNICEIGKERIRRAGAKILEEAKANKDMFSEDNPLDVGFKVYRMISSNFKKYTPVSGQDKEAENSLFKELEGNLVPLVDGWKSENVLTEIILKQGFALDCTKEKVDSFKKNTIWKITDSADTVSKKIKLYVCLDNSIEEETIKNLTLNDDEKFICLDAAIDDSAYARLADKGRIETI